MNDSDVISSFDKLSQFYGDGWNHNSHYHKYLLKFLPTKRYHAIDIGSGVGEFTRLLSKYFNNVEGIDFSPKMINIAISNSYKINNIKYIFNDFMRAEYNDCSFDCIASIAAFHHLPFKEAIQKVKRILQPNGHFILLDLYKSKTLIDYLFSLFGIIANNLRNVIHKAEFNAEIAEAWQEHSKLDHFLSFNEIKRICKEVLPNSIIRRHIYFRYSVIWSK